MSDTLKLRVSDAVKDAMRAGDKARLGTLRLAMAAIKQREVDERVALDDTAVLAVLDKMVKQRRESIEHYEKGARGDLAEREQAEIEILREFMPQPLSEAELDALIAEAIEQARAESMRDMGQVMGVLKPEIQGRADMAQVSKKVRDRLS